MSMQKTFLFAVFCIILISSAHADNDICSNPISPLFALTPVAAFIATIIVALAYMASQFFMNQQLEGWAKLEFRELIIAIIIVALIYGAAVVSTNDVLKTLTGYSNPTPLATLLNDVQNKFSSYEAKLILDYQDTIRASNRIGILSSYSYTSSLGGYIFTYSSTGAPYMGGAGLMQELNLLAGSLSNGIMVYEAMLLLMKFTFCASFQYLLPLGFILRLIPFSRKIGGTIIGLALAGIFVFPISMAIVAAFHDSIDVPNASNLHTHLTAHDFAIMTINIPTWLVNFCTNQALRTLTSVNEIGWWAVICTPLCLTKLAICISACGPGAAACAPACYTAFNFCILPFTGLCWSGISYPAYNDFQLFSMVAANIASVQAASGFTAKIGNDFGLIFDSITDRLIVPANNAAMLPFAEAVFVGAFVIIGARALSNALAGESYIQGLERLI